MVTIGAAVSVNVTLIKEGIESNSNYAQTINLAGRQRFLSQKILSEIIFRSAGQMPSGNVDSLVSVWANVHEGLQHGDAALNLRGTTSEAVIKHFEQLNPVQKNLAQKLSSLNKTGIDSNSIVELKKLQLTYVQLMDSTVNALQEDTETKIKRIKDRQVWAAFFSGLALILEILIFVIPYHKKLILAYAQLKHNKKLIEEQTEEIQQQVNLLAESNHELERLNATQELTLEGINAGVWDWEIETGMEEWSVNFYTILGYAKGELTPSFETFANLLLHKDDKEKVETAIQRHLMYDEPYNVEIRLLNKDGKYRWYEASGKAAKDANGKPVRMAGSIIDIDEKMTYQRQLEEMNRGKDKIFAIISHDFRSPLNGMKALLELQTMGILSQQEFTEHIQQLSDGVDFTLRTLDNMLVWAMTQMGNTKVTPANMDIKKLLEDVAQFHRYNAQQKHHEISYEADSQIAAYADPNHLFVIVRNLVGNAIKFTPNNGLIKVTAALDGAYVKIAVQDNGVGMTAEQMEKVLGRQQNTSSYGTNGEKGTGLGMSLVQDLLQMNGGKLSIQSEPGKGSMITAYIPAAMA